MEELFERYLATLERRRVSPLTVKANRHALSLFERWLQTRNVSAIAVVIDDCEHYLDERLSGHAVATVRRDLAMLRGAYRHATQRGLVAGDPTIGVRLPPLPDRDPVVYNADELRAIHAAIRDQREQLIFFLLAFTGLRLCEATSLTWADVDLPNTQLRVTGKGGKRRIVPLHPTLDDLLTTCQPDRDHAPLVTTVAGGRVADRTWGTIVSRLVARADVHVPQPSHAFRRTVASELYANGIRTHVIDRLLGWSPRTVRDRHYVRIADPAMRAAIATLYQASPIYPEQTLPQPTPDTIAAWTLAADSRRLAQLESL